MLFEIMPVQNGFKKVDSIDYMKQYNEVVRFYEYARHSIRHSNRPISSFIEEDESQQILSEFERKCTFFHHRSEVPFFLLRLFLIMYPRKSQKRFTALWLSFHWLQCS